MTNLLDYFKKKRKCYHQWRYFNHWCQECGEFTDNKNHGVVVSHCFKCDRLWDIDDGFWTADDIRNIFFIMFYKGKV